jgi:hypothetical protein
MKSIILIIDLLIKYSNIHFDNAFLIEYDTFKFSSFRDSEFYKFYFVKFTDNYDFQKIYIHAKKIKNILKKYIRKKKNKKILIFDCNTDFYGDSLDSFKKWQICEIIDNNTKYKFKLNDLITLWSDSLSNSQNLFSKPFMLKNPYTNIPFKIHNLYNIYYFIHYSPYHIPKLIYLFYLSEFNIEFFIYNNYPLLKENAIDYFINHAPSFEVWEQLDNMIIEFKDDLKIELNSYYMPPTKQHIINELKEYVSYYVRATFSCNPLRRRNAHRICKKRLIEYFNKEPAFTYKLLNESIQEITYQTPIPLSINTELNSNDIIDEILSDSEQSISSINQLIDDPFVPSEELTRTPPSRIRNNNYARMSLFPRR